MLFSALKVCYDLAVADLSHLAQSPALSGSGPLEVKAGWVGEGCQRGLPPPQSREGGSPFSRDQGQHVPGL